MNFVFYLFKGLDKETIAIHRLHPDLVKEANQIKYLD